MKPMHLLTLLLCIWLAACTATPATGGTGAASMPVPGAPAEGVPQPAPAATLALVNGTLIDDTGADPLPAAVVLISKDRIVAVGPAGQVQIPAGVEGR